MPLASGDWVNPNIQLVRKLDEGSMGSVWLANHAVLDTEVAVKFVAERLIDNPTALRRIESEARAAAQLRSPHVVKIFDFGLHEQRNPYIVMEYLEGESLGTRLEREGTLPPYEVAVILTHAARGLHQAHKVGIIHRDIKPDNLFIQDTDGSPFVKVLDFGVARGITKNLTDPNSLVGTPIYMSRESIVDKHIDHRLDLWALAVVAYEALTGEFPFDGETLDEVCIAIWRGTFTAPSELNPTLTPEIDEWFRLAFHSDKDERPTTAKNLASSFIRAVASVPGALLDGNPESWRMSQLDLLPYAGISNAVSGDLLPMRGGFDSIPNSEELSDESSRDTPAGADTPGRARTGPNRMAETRDSNDRPLDLDDEDRATSRSQAASKSSDRLSTGEVVVRPVNSGTSMRPPRLAMSPLPWLGAIAVAAIAIIGFVTWASPTPNVATGARPEESSEALPSPGEVPSSSSPKRPYEQASSVPGTESAGSSAAAMSATPKPGSMPPNGTQPPKPVSAKPGPAKPGPAKPGPAKPVPAKPGPAKPGPAEPAEPKAPEKDLGF